MDRLRRPARLSRRFLVGLLSVAFALCTTGIGAHGAVACPIYYVVVHVEPVIPTNLGDRVVGPVTVYVVAPGAERVDVYLQAVEVPYGGRRLGPPELLGSGATVDGRLFAVAWAADEPYPYVEVFAVAYGQPDVNFSRASAPVTILLDWRLRPAM